MQAAENFVRCGTVSVWLELGAKAICEDTMNAVSNHT